MMSEPEHTLHFLIPLHRAAVEETLTYVLGYESVRGLPVLEVVSQVYEAMDNDEQLLMCHEEPFDAACDIAGVPYETRRFLFLKNSKTYSIMMERYDNAAEELASDSDYNSTSDEDSPQQII